MYKKIAKIIGLVLVSGLALVGAAFVAVFFALKFHWTDVPGAVDTRSADFADLAADSTNSTPTTLPAVDTTTPTEKLTPEQADAKIAELEDYKTKLANQTKDQQTVLCRLEILAPLAGNNTRAIWDAYKKTNSSDLVKHMIFAVEPYVSKSYAEDVKQCDDATTLGQYTETTLASAIDQSSSRDTSKYLWVQAEEWPSLHTAVTKDADMINEIATKTGVPARLIVGALTVEQLRLYHTQREYYEKYFQPLKILANATDFAWGVMSIKEAAAKQIEANLYDKTSPYYLGPEYEHMLDFSKSDHDAERLARLTNEHNHYYSYLYGALYFKQYIQQWKAAGFDISDRPEILITLFNIGFTHSKPKADPAVGGSTIEINNHNFTFGSLGFEVFYSGEFTDQFPY